MQSVLSGKGGYDVSIKPDYVPPNARSDYSEGSSNAVLHGTGEALVCSPAGTRYQCLLGRLSIL